MHYLYSHTRLDTNEVFYIGIGKVYSGSERTKYERAFAKSKRTKFWKSIIAKTKYRVDILFEHEDLKLIKSKEIAFIAQYGRRWKGEGSLVNFSSGGEFNDGPKSRGVRITQLSLEGEKIKVWEELKDISTNLGYSITNIVKCCRKKQLSAYGFKWEYTDNRSFDQIRATAARKKNTNRRVGIIVTWKKTGEVKEFITIKEVSEYTGYHQDTIGNYLRGESQNKLLKFEYRKWNDLNN